MRERVGGLGGMEVGMGWMSKGLSTLTHVVEHGKVVASRHECLTWAPDSECKTSLAFMKPCHVA